MTTVETPPLRWRDRGWETSEPWTVQANGAQVTIPEGFRFDLASIPHLFRSILDKEDLGVAGPLTHDWLYQHRGQVQATPPTRFTRRATDRIFRQIMDADGVGFIRRWVAWAAVRGFGWFPWPPSKSFLRGALIKGAHTVWQGAAGYAVTDIFEWHPAWAILIGGLFSLVKSLAIVPVAERVAGTVYS